MSTQRIEVSYRKSDVFYAEVTPSKSIHIYGGVQVNERELPITGETQAERLYLEAMESGGDAWLVLADYLDESGYGAADFCRRWCEQLAKGHDDARAQCIRHHVQRRKPVYRHFNKTFHIGDEVVYDSYNLTYTGKITSIGPKTVSVDASGTGDSTKRMKLGQFIDRNWDLNLDRIRDRNAETMMHI